jgi:sugar phosphate isomerase/epimerase
MRLGAPILETWRDPDDWIQKHRERRYSAAYCPVDLNTDDSIVEEYRHAAAEADLVIAEVGAWCNLCHPDPAVRETNLQHNIRCLELAEKIRARCCVNTPGSLAPDMCTPHPGNLTRTSFDLIVSNTRRILEAVQPIHTRYTVEAMPYMFPDSPDSYLELIAAIDHPGFGVHLDIVNWINSPRRYFANAEFSRECLEKLGSRVASIHLKDTLMTGGLMIHIDEVPPGEGTLDHAVFIEEASRWCDPDTPILMEHLMTEEAYQKASDVIRRASEDSKHPFH